MCVCVRALLLLLLLSYRCFIQLFEDDYPTRDVSGHIPYNKPLAFDAVLGTNARLGVLGAPIVNGPSSTRKDYPEKVPLGEFCCFLLVTVIPCVKHIVKGDVKGDVELLMAP